MKEIPSFVELRKYAKIKGDHVNPDVKMAICGSMSTQHIAEAIKGYGGYRGYTIEIYDAGYDQIDIQLLNPESDIYRFMPNIILIYLGVEKIYEEYLSEDNRTHFADNYLLALEEIWERVKAYSVAKIFQCLPPEFNDGILGSFADKRADSFLYQIRKPVPAGPHPDK